MDEEQDIPLTEEDEADLAESLAEHELHDKVRSILAAFDGKETAITDAGRENTRTVNRLARVTAIRHVHTDKTFRHNISYYQADGIDEQIMIGARRAGNGIWTLVAALAPAGRSGQ
jgi:hypothetical protein